MERDTCLDCRHYYKTDTCKLTGRLAEPAYTACGKFTPRVDPTRWQAARVCMLLNMYDNNGKTWEPYEMGDGIHHAVQWTGESGSRVGGLYWWKKENVRNWFDAWKTAQEILEAEK